MSGKSSTTLRRLAVVAGSALAATALTLAMSAQPAAAKTATQTGWHTVCADDLTVYNGGPIEVLHWYEGFSIDHFASEGHVWGTTYPKTGGSQYGWVYNGWFC